MWLQSGEEQAAGWLWLDTGPLEVERVTERVLERGREGMEMYDIDCEEMEEEEEDLKIMLSQSQFQVEKFKSSISNVIKIKARQIIGFTDLSS